MIGQAILAHPRKRLSLAEIYNWISGAFPFYRKGEAGWMNSIRHNLSLNKCFVKVEREKSRDSGAVVVGKGMLWAIEDGCEHQFEGGGFNKKYVLRSDPVGLLVLTDLSPLFSPWR
jgi:forkhead transcription factor HCM1